MQPRFLFFLLLSALGGCNLFSAPDSQTPNDVADSGPDSADIATSDAPDLRIPTHDLNEDFVDLVQFDCVDESAQFSTPSVVFASANSALFSMRPLGTFDGYCGFEVQFSLTVDELDSAATYPVAETDAPTNTLDYFATSLLPDSDYFFRFRPLGGATWSDVATFNTSPSFDPSNAFELFTETLPPGAYTLPSDVSISNIEPYEGSTHLTYLDSDCFEPRCFENLRIQELNIPPAAGFVPSSATLEFAIWYVDALEVPWTEIRLNAGEGNVFTLKGLRFQPTTNYALVQIPFSALADADGTLASDFPWTEFDLFWVGANWPRDTRVHIDSVIVRWR